VDVARFRALAIFIRAAFIQFNLGWLPKKKRPGLCGRTPVLGEPEYQRGVAVRLTGAP